MLWITRPRPHIDRTASAWLIRRFIDREARFDFAPTLAEAQALGGTPFDMPGAELGHHAGRCTFETLLEHYHLDEPALREIAAMVRDVDLDEEPHATPEAAGLDAILRGLAAVMPDDQELLRYTGQLYEGLYAWARSQVR